MKRARKIKQALIRRVSAWDDMNGSMVSPNVKIPKEPNGMVFRKPGSQNCKKGRSGRKSHR